MNPVVPESLVAEMEVWAAHIRALAVAWQQVGPQAGGALTVRSPFTRDREAFRAWQPDAPENIENAAL